ncbi:MAG: hypothetical protein KIT84_35300 [Labilithrix sp.]|nr:hypothetical protein [Labilithrix sp.]MCW5816318.1 hypothetical protein [Labilithrix sp.]
MRRLVAFVVVPLAACSLMTDLDGFVAPGSPDAAPPEIEDAGSDVVADASAPEDADAEVDVPAIDAATRCSDRLLVGHDVLAGSIVDDIPASVIDTFGYEAVAAGRAECIWVYLETPPSSITLGVYAPRPSGTPQALLARAEIAAPVKGWNSARLDRPLDVVVKQRVWLGMTPLSGPLQNRIHEGGCGDLYLRAADAPRGGTPDPYPSQTTDYTYACSALMYLAPLE